MKTFDQQLLLGWFGSILAIPWVGLSSWFGGLDWAG